MSDMNTLNSIQATVCHLYTWMALNSLEINYLYSKKILGVASFYKTSERALRISFSWL